MLAKYYIRCLKKYNAQSGSEKIHETLVEFRYCIPETNFKQTFLGVAQVCAKEQ